VSLPTLGPVGKEGLFCCLRYQPAPVASTDPGPKGRADGREVAERLEKLGVERGSARDLCGPAPLSFLGYDEPVCEPKLRTYRSGTRVEGDCW
jgi:hypothetical protein